MILWFRRLVFLQALLGIVGLCMAERNPVTLLTIGALACASWYVTEGPSGRALPPRLTLVGALVAVAWLLFELYRDPGYLIGPLGHFVMWLQLLLLYSHKTNRDDGQILVLSLLQMICATIVSSSGPALVFAILLGAYCVTGLCTLLLFQIKMSWDIVHVANRKMAPPSAHVAPPKAVTGRGHRLQFRAMAMVIGLACTGTAALVFLTAPRIEPRSFAQGLLVPTQHRAGFNTMLDLTQSPSSVGDREPVLTLALTGDPFSDFGTDRLLRGTTMDYYDPMAKSWIRRSVGSDEKLDLRGQPAAFLHLTDTAGLRRARITQLGGRDHHLFSLHPIRSIESDTIDTVFWNSRDHQLVVDPAGPTSLTYVVEAPRRVPRNLRDAYGQSPQIDDDEPHEEYGTGWFVGAARIEARALEVLREAGLHRDVQADPSPSDESIGGALVDHLRSNYRYALNNLALTRGHDPIMEFLFTHKTGHCELFASALTAMARSIGMRARVVTGYRVSEYNSVGGYYVVRRGNAHAWTEIDCGAAGWRAFDATPPRELADEHESTGGSWSLLRNLYEHLELAWVQSVVSYDEEGQADVMGRLGRSLHRLGIDRHTWPARLSAWWKQIGRVWQIDQITLIVIATTALFIPVGLAMLIHIVVVRRRRVVALQLTALPRQQRRALARRLRFYLVMLDKLERHGFVRPRWQSPFGFAEKLAAADPVRFNAVVALTELFYEVRFGYRDLDTDRRTRIHALLRRLDATLAR